MFAAVPSRQTRASRACVRGAKTRIWGFCRPPATRAPVFGAQTTKPRQVAKAAATKSASGPSQWPNRDPIGENGGVNLFAMVENNPISFIDPLGLNIYAIDGTNFDVSRNAAKGQTYSNVWDFYQRRMEPGVYFGGPASSNPSEGIADAHGYETYDLVKRVLARIQADYCADPTIKINIVGWSRGATAAAEIARRLERDGLCCAGVTKKPVNVNFLGLYDAVEMVFNLSELLPGDQGFANKIGANTQHFFHATKTQNQFLFPTTYFGGPNEVGFDLNTKSMRGRPGSMQPDKSSHGDIGVSATNNNAHREMVNRAKSAGVQIDTAGL